MNLWKRRRPSGGGVLAWSSDQRAAYITGGEAVFQHAHITALHDTGLLDGATLTYLDDEGYPGLVHAAWPIPTEGDA